MSLPGSLRTLRRQLHHFTVTRRIVSFGGVGSSSLVAHLENGDPDRIWYHSRHKHCLDLDLLPEARRGLEVRVCAIFGDPFASVSSVFRRGLQRRLERSMTRTVRGYTPVLRGTTTIQEYLAGGVDRFFLEDHLDAWLGYKGKRARVLAVKYEALEDHLPEVLAFLECDRPFRLRRRGSRFEDSGPEVRAGLERIYGKLRARIQRLPSLIRVR